MHHTRLLALFALLVPCVACDQAAKALAVTHLKGSANLHFVDGMFRLVYAENPGAFLGLGRALPDGVRTILFTLGVLAILSAVSYYAVRRLLPPAMFLGMALLVAGGVGNLVDRVSRPGGRVVDFAQITLPIANGAVRTGIFNVADVHIVVGAGLVALATLKRRKRGDGDEPPSEAPPTPSAGAPPSISDVVVSAPHPSA